MKINRTEHHALQNKPHSLVQVRAIAVTGANDLQAKSLCINNPIVTYSAKNNVKGLRLVQTDREKKDERKRRRSAMKKLNG